LPAIVKWTKSAEVMGVEEDEYRREECAQFIGSISMHDAAQ
jgi:hypothetical protein